ncbi:endonuclease MutS2 [Murdochiella massiliensis]|uniref:endonuclease MutS2 n=1 Tax=Murdochiella massiliensis TaxID=1673723 RepID=UPI00082E1F50|nr:endonuclease MutS2 [Murdochiella massiliensis]
MQDSVLKTLEYDKILALVADHAQSAIGRDRILALRPSTERETVLQTQEETADAVRLLLAFGNPPLFGIYPIRAALKRAALGGVLSMRDLLHIADTLRVSRELQRYVAEAEDGVMVRAIHSLFLQDGLERAISDSILTEDTMADTASRALYTIRQKLRTKNDQIKIRLNEILAHAAQAGYLNENLITMRDGRYVLPVKAANRNQVKGVVHDSSGSGQTAFVEPLAIVELNNEIRSLEGEEEEEIQRILADLSQEVAEFEEELGGNEQVLIHLDFTFAKAQYALATGCSQPTFSMDRSIALQQARHPLLGKNVVPIDIRLGKDYTTLIITGPNTGGKTVTLKTLGLLQAMAQSGLQIPARTPSVVGIFSFIYADIGDKQSIEQSLSTFSASMTNIVHILASADRDALLLFDELGSGTDPTEGAAMAMAILKQLRDQDIRTVATTHYAELKLFAIQEEGVQNASVEFDVETLSPTYRLVIGLPGRSNAFEISKRLGLSEDILREAESYLDHGTIRFENVLADIEKSRQASEEERLQIRREREAYQQKLIHMKQELEQAQQAYERRMQNAEQQARDIIKEARETAQDMLRDAKDALKGERPALDRAYNKVHESAKDFEKKHQKVKADTNRPGPQNLQMGESVKILSLNQTGVLVEGPDRNGDVKVQMGILSVSSNVRDLARVAEPDRIVTPKASSSFVSVNTAQNSLPYLDLRGERFDDAMRTVDKYLDDCVLAGYNKVRIIHGKGTGALRKGIHERLKHDRRVVSFAFADVREGGTGATDVVLK